jgi:hypothetical protein
MTGPALPALVVSGAGDRGLPGLSAGDGGRDDRAMNSRAALLPILVLILAACTPGASGPITHPASASLPPASPGVAGYAEPADFSGVLAAHSRWRQQVGTPDLLWSEAAARHAQDWADTLARERDCQAAHSPEESRRHRLGENIYTYWRGTDYEGYRRDAAYVVDAWGSEVQWYRGDTHRCEAPAGQSCGHYTQVVSTLSTHVGCGRARCPNAEVWVCNYSPPGNYRDSAPY